MFKYNVGNNDKYERVSITLNLSAVFITCINRLLNRIFRFDLDVI